MLFFHVQQEFQSKLLHQITFPNELFARGSVLNISVHIMPQCCVYILFIPWKWLSDLTPVGLTVEISQEHTAAEQQESVCCLEEVLTLISDCVSVTINPSGMGTMSGPF